MGIFNFNGNGKKKKGGKSEFVPVSGQLPVVQSPKKDTHKTIKKNTGVVGTVSPSSPTTTAVRHQETSGHVGYGTDKGALPKGEPVGTVAPTDTVHPLYDPQSEVPAPVYASSGSFFYRKQPVYVYKKLVDKKLTIILVEDTTLIGKEHDTLIKIIKNIGSEGKVCIITYGESVKQSEVFELQPNTGIPFPVNENVGDKACLFDALIAVQKMVSDMYSKIEETDTQRIRINSIDVIGIGTCTDNGSQATKEEAFDAFYKVTTMLRVMTKYFCLTEGSFMNAAEAGFRSIGAISRNYQ